MNILMVVLSFFKTFILKYLTTVALEKILITSLRELVKRTDSKYDDEIFEIVFSKQSK